ncbi:ROK family transcriptional regulator [Paeniglutamicibacter sp. Y32M11]|uniref:ROK family transcriptional regulator n=1 Tax=Paeniglutamicibacter sp. Y32M11 TaxID=2853258 RepID=UPI001C52D2C5|nr:ROK family transcriptional regulator [Paeniglutamicibacter sp. Y32M11]QXQ09916.1 ROK family transcriptional regulator [Paeniglutamicibacter sp. Y32M11]
MITAAASGTPDRPLPQSLAIGTDRRFLDQLLRNGPSSRTAIAAATGLSRPTASEAAARLSETGLLRIIQTPPSNKRGRIPEIYDLDPAYGHTLSLAAAAGQTRVQTHDLRGTLLHDTSADLPHSITPAEFDSTLRELISTAVSTTGSPCLAATASQGNPVDPLSQRPVVLPASAFPEGRGDVGALLRTFCDGPVRLDNDVNWATLAEQRMGVARGIDELINVYLGPGIGAGLVMSGMVQRGRHGAAGELSYLRSGGRTLISQLLDHGVAAPGTDRLDVPGCLALFATTPAPHNAELFVAAVAQQISNIAAITDPQALVLSGPIANNPPFIRMLSQALKPLLVNADLQVLPSALGADAPLIGASLAARDLAEEHFWSGYRC